MENVSYVSHYNKSECTIMLSQHPHFKKLGMWMMGLRVSVLISALILVYLQCVYEVKCGMYEWQRTKSSSFKTTSYDLCFSNVLKNCKIFALFLVMQVFTLRVMVLQKEFYRHSPMEVYSIRTLVWFKALLDVKSTLTKTIPLWWAS